MRETGVYAGHADRIATPSVAAVEGTVAMCHAQRTITPLDDVTAELTQLVAQAIPATTSASRHRKPP